MPKYDDKTLLENAQRDPAAFGAIFDAYYEQILRYATRRTGNISIAEDITAETVTKAMQSIQRFAWRGVPLSAWLYKIATNQIHMHHRSRARAVLSLDEMYEQTEFEPTSDKLIEQEAIQAQTILERKTDFLRAQRMLALLP